MDHPERALNPTEALKRRDRYLVSSPTSGPTFGLIDDAPFSYSFDEDNADHSTGASTDDGKSELSVSCNSSCRGYYRFSYCDGYTPMECHTQSGDYNSFSGSFYCRQSAPGGERGECVSTAGWGEHFTTNNLLSNLKYCDAENGNVVDIFYTDEVCNTIASSDTHAKPLTGGDECDCDDYGSPWFDEDTAPVPAPYPSPVPTSVPTEAPTVGPTPYPSSAPTILPSPPPSESPTEVE